jgi:TonB-linked SusC/RagA family outer membrane protein
VKGSTLSDARETNLVNALSGRIAGVQVTNSSGTVGSSSRIVLRGVSSLSSSNDPLFVVDGIPFDNTSNGNSDSGGGRDLPNGVASINPDDIESVTVLKGPTAAALYGIRASKGVIIITTKTGKNQKGLGVTFNSNTTFSNPLVLPSFQNSYGQSGATPNFFQYTDGGLTDVAADGTDESWGAPLDKGLSFVQWDSYKNGGAPKPWISHPNNVKNFYDTGVAQTNTLSLTGGNEFSNFRFSVGNSNEKGMVPFTNFNKFNVSGNGNLKFGKFTGGITFGYYNDKSTNLPTSGYDSNNVASQFIWAARNVNYTDLKDWRNLPKNLIGPVVGTPINWNNNYNNNPYWILENNTNTFEKDRVNGAFNLGYEFSKSFKWTGKVMLDNFSERTTGREAVGSQTNFNGSFYEQDRKYKEINAEMLFTYNKNISEDIGFNVNLGGNQLKRIQSSVFGSIVALELPGLYNLSNNKAGSVPQYGNSYQEQKINSVFGFGQLSYKSYFYLDFTGRNDWVSVLPNKNNSFFYPSVNGSLVLSDIFKTSSAGLQLLKLRGGWAKVGGLGAITPYRINRTFALDLNGFGTQANLPNDVFNPNSKPEATIGKEIGLDATAFNNRLRFAATYYDQNGIDLLLPLEVSRTTGYTRKWSNDANVTNKGIEISLGGTLVKSDDFSFDVDLNFARNRNKVVSLGEVESQLVSTNAFGLQLVNRVGNQTGDLFGAGFLRDSASGEVIYENGLPVVDVGNPKVLGNVTPDWTGGANFAIRYKGFDLNTLIDAKIGGDIYSQSYTWGRYAGTLAETIIGRETGVVGNGVMADGNGGYVKNNVVINAKDFNQRTYNQNVYESSIFDASFVKWRQLVIGYSLPAKWLRGTFIKEFKISAIARNLAIIYKKVPHIDPESAFSSSNANQGQEFGQLPSARTIGFNVNIKF